MSDITGNTGNRGGNMSGNTHSRRSGTVFGWFVATVAAKLTKRRNPFYGGRRYVTEVYGNQRQHRQQFGANSPSDLQKKGVATCCHRGNTRHHITTDVGSRPHEQIHPR